MSQVVHCPDPGRLRELLEGERPPEEQSDLICHLDSCDSCQHALEEMAAGSASSSEALRHLDRDKPPADSAFWKAVQKLEADSGEVTATYQRSAGEGQEDLSLEFLQPSERPGFRGRIGHFEVEDVIGHGGMGVVLRAFDPCLQRRVAIKVLDPKLADNDVARKRFCREARAAAAITHENVIAIHQVDEEESNGLPYLVMQLVNGGSLQDRLDRGAPLEPREILSFGAQAAAGLMAAHGQGLIHRDIKPANILLENGEKVKLTDFGLARAAEDAKLTQTGYVAGTPLYMAPEQAKGEPVDHRSDLFSLGSVMYAMATGKPPFEGNTPFLVLRRVTEEHPKPIPELNPDMPLWLVDVIDKLLAKNPKDRFQSAAEVAELLSLHLGRLQYSGNVPCPKARLAAYRLKRRQGTLLGLAGLFLLSALFVTERRGMTRFTSLSTMPTAASSSGEDPVSPEHVGTLDATTGPIWSLAFSPDGQTLVMALDDGSVKIWDVGEKQLNHTLKAHAGPVWAAAFSPEGERLATASDDGTVKLWDTNWKEFKILDHKAAVRSVAFSPDGSRLVTGGRNGKVYLWDAVGKESAPLKVLEGHHGVVMAVAFSPDGKTLASASGDSTAKLWNADDGVERATLSKHTSGVYGLAFSGDSKTLATGGWDKTVRLWNVSSGTEKTLLRGHAQDVWAVAFERKGNLLASASEDRHVKVWDAGAGHEVATYTGHTRTLYAVAFSPDGKLVASGGRDGTVKLWQVRTEAAWR